jgi:hypothetical protein
MQLNLKLDSATLSLTVFYSLFLSKQTNKQTNSPFKRKKEKTYFWTPPTKPQCGEKAISIEEVFPGKRPAQASFSPVLPHP